MACILNFPDDDERALRAGEQAFVDSLANIEHDPAEVAHVVKAMRPLLLSRCPPLTVDPADPDASAKILAWHHAGLERFLARIFELEAELYRACRRSPR